MSILDEHGIGGDLRAEIMRDKGVATAAWWNAPEALNEQVILATASEGAGKAYAYTEWLVVAVMALKRAHRLCEAGRVPGKGGGA